MEKIFKSTKGRVYIVEGENIKTTYKNGLELFDDVIKKGNSIKTVSHDNKSSIVLESIKDITSFKEAFYGYLYTTEFMPD